MASSPAIPAAPLVTDILFIAHGGPRQSGIAMEFLDAQGDPLASGLTDWRALMAIGRQAMAVAAAARACDPAVVPIGLRPRGRSRLLVDAPADEVDETKVVPDRRLEQAQRAEFVALCYLVVALLALLLSVALFAWAIWA